MATKRDYQEAMRLASSAAWDLDWDGAIEAYQDALQISHDDPQALTGLALAHLEKGNYTQAVEIYQRVSRIVPTDPLPYEKIAEIHEMEGRLQEAATAYLEVAELYYSRKDLTRAVDNWEHALNLNSDLPKAHMRLAVWYEQRKEIKRAIVHYVEVARLLQSFGKLNKAEESLNRALNVDPTSLAVRDALDDLKRNRPIERSEAYSTPGTVTGKAPRRVPVVEDEDEADEEQFEERLRSPVDETARMAMALLADMVWSGNVPSKAQIPLVQAIDAHQAGDIDEALNGYQQVKDAGVQHSALEFNLAMLHEYVENDSNAQPILSRLIDDEDYALAGRILLGKIAARRSNYQDAAEHLLNALYLADQEMNTQLDDPGYQRLRDSLPTMQSDSLEELTTGLTIYLNDGNWRKKLTDTLGGYAAQGKDSYVSDLIELIVEGGRPVLAEIMQRIDRFIERSMFELASQEAHYAIEKSPDYLPAHRRIADILVAGGRSQEAAEKINFVAETYLVRGNDEKAADLFAEVLEIWPADMEARKRVLQMLRHQGRVNEALHHYIELAELYRRMADSAKAMNAFEEALNYGRSGNAESPQMVAILKALADIEAQRFNWPKALGYYQQILEMAPGDQDASLSVVDLFFQMGDPGRAVTTLDDYMRQCITRGNTEVIVPTLEEQVRKHPEEVALRERLARVYQRQNRIEDALVQLNEIGDMQIEAGEYETASRTIKRIIALNPPDAEQYKQLLRQLESSS